jgi:putative salt-induced outer membrane protein YdiY
MNVNYVVGQEWARSLFSVYRIYCVITDNIWSGYVKYSVLYKGYSLQLIICACHSWHMALNAGLDVSFDNMQDWNRIREIAGEVNSKKAYIAN